MPRQARHDGWKARAEMVEERLEVATQALKKCREHFATQPGWDVARNMEALCAAALSDSAKIKMEKT